MDEQIINYFLGKLTEDEQLELLRERELNTETKETFSYYQNLMAVLSLSSGLTDNEKALHKLRLFKRRKQAKKVKRTIYRYIGYAAAISLTIVSTWFLTTHNNNSQESISVGQQELYVPVGQHARITLPDGTVAWLNAGSTLTYPSIFGEERKVSLTGEAYFDVAINEECPFVVATEAINIKALGTQFNVSSYPRATYKNIILVEGSVRIYKPDAESEGIILAPNQQLFYENGVFHRELFSDENVLLWKDGVYSFKNEKLDAIINKLELYFDVDIIIECPSLLEKEFTGKFRQKDGVMEILRIIQKIHPFNLKINEELNQITLS